MNEMSIEQKLEIIRVALEKGSSVSLNIHGDFSKAAAEEVVNNLAEKFEIPVKNVGVGDWFNIGTHPFELTIFYKLSNEDKKKELLAQLAELEGGQINEQAN